MILTSRPQNELLTDSSNASAFIVMMVSVVAVDVLVLLRLLLGVGRDAHEDLRVCDSAGGGRIENELPSNFLGARPSQIGRLTGVRGENDTGPFLFTSGPWVGIGTARTGRGDKVDVDAAKPIATLVTNILLELDAFALFASGLRALPVNLHFFHRTALWVGEVRIDVNGKHLFIARQERFG